jgi:hypothetical protein
MMGAKKGWVMVLVVEERCALNVKLIDFDDPTKNVYSVDWL